MVNAKGVPHTVLFGTNKIARIDPKTLEMKEYALPDAGSRPRRMAYGADDSIYYTDYPRGMLGRPRPAERQGHRVALARRAEVRTLRHRVRERRDLVQRVGHAAEHHRSLRPEDREVPDLGDPLGRLHRAQDGRYPDGNPVIATSTVNGVGLVEVK